MAKAKAAGSFIGGLFNNPTFLILGALGVILLFFQGDIRKAFANLGKIEIPPIELPTINLPTINLPEIKFPALPDFTGFFTGLQEQQENFFTKFINQFNLGISADIPKPTKMVEDTGLIDFSKCQCGATVIQDAFGNVFSECKQCQVTDTALPSQDPSLNIPDTNGFVGGIGGGLLDFLGLTPAQEFAISKGGFEVPKSNPFGIGGGGSFIGGTTTFGDTDNIVDTLSEVLNIFPNLTASQAADALAQNVGLTANEFAQVDPDIINISSSGFDSDQIILNASGGFSGLTPEQIAFILTGGNISNF